MNDETTQILNQLATGNRVEMWEAAKAITDRHESVMVPALLNLLRAGEATERRVAAAWALGFLRSPAALELLIEILRNKSEPHALRDQAAESLGYLADRRAREALVENLSDANGDVVFSCAFALRTVGTKADIPHLEGLTHNLSLVNYYGASIAEEAGEAIEQIKTRYDQKT